VLAVLLLFLLGRAAGAAGVWLSFWSLVSSPVCGAEYLTRQPLVDLSVLERLGPCLDFRTRRRRLRR
jgi:hypothetical protein